MSKTIFADPHDEFDKDFINWVVDIMSDVDDPYSSFDDYSQDEDIFVSNFLNSTEKSFYDESD